MLKFRSIQTRLTCYFSIILLPLIGLSLFANMESLRIIEEKIGERTENALKSEIDYLDLTLQGIEELSNVMATDENIVTAVEHNANKLNTDMIYDFSIALKKITQMKVSNHIVSELSVVHSPSETMISSQYGSRSIRDLKQQAWYRQAVEANGRSVVYIPQENQYNTNEELDPVFNTNTVTFMRLMNVYGTQAHNSLLAISVKKDTLLDFTKDLIPSEKTEVYLIAGDGRLIAGTSELAAELIAERPGAYRPSSDSVATLPEMQDVMTVSARSDMSNWSLVMVQPKSEIRAETALMRYYTYAIIGISLLLAVVISWIVYSGISSPLAKLSVGMKKLQMGNYDVRLSKQRSDEFGYLTESFNLMAQSQQHLIQDIYQHQLKLTKAELKFLQSQINPHFLYNTLDSIYAMSMNYDAHEISEMVLNLSKFFRLSLRKGTETATVKDTITHLDYYIRIQQIRFMDQFAVEYRISQDSEDLRLHKLLLQPLVENAIHHGLEYRPDSGQLTISSEVSYREGIRHQLVLSVYDNGAGLDQARLKHIRQELSKVELDKLNMPDGNEVYNDLFGLRNVKSRLLLYYGQEAELHIDSGQKVNGTLVTVTIPIRQLQAQIPE
ncbi:sensor histidine kinase [Paenibacillus chungangensis]|uniref:Sensor histidine kinase n=1 Tax=Paenibacillus chungangensis TaxID=696535 RepID=A0ABW3HUG8_9BACL